MPVLFLLSRLKHRALIAPACTFNLCVFFRSGAPPPASWLCTGDAEGTASCLASPKCKDKGNQGSSNSLGTSDSSTSNHLSSMAEQSLSPSCGGGGKSQMWKWWEEKMIGFIWKAEPSFPLSPVGASGVYPFQQISTFRQLTMLSSPRLSHWFRLYRRKLVLRQQSTACPLSWLLEYKPHTHLEPFCWLTAFEWKEGFARGLCFLKMPKSNWDCYRIICGVKGTAFTGSGNTNECCKVLTFFLSIGGLHLKSISPITVYWSQTTKKQKGNQNRPTAAKRGSFSPKLRRYVLNCSPGVIFIAKL